MSNSEQITIQANLTNVPETMLWTLHNRANEAMREDGFIHDPKCISIYQAINYDYERSFGKADGSHGMRSMIFDKYVLQFIQQHKNAVIVNLGDGLETQQFRIHHTDVLWLSIDLPEAIAMRERFIQPTAQCQHIAKSVLDISWFDAVPMNRPVFITAQGLFMYFTENQLSSLFQAMAKRFSGAILMFDYLSEAFSKRTLGDKGWQKTKYYRTPEMPWGVNRNHLATTLSKWIGYPITVNNIDYRFPRGIYRYLFPILQNLPVIKNRLPSICYIQFK